MLETYRESWVDFVQAATLCRRAGCTAGDLALVAAKELIDNAFDASPKGVDVYFDDRTLSVQDRGAGLSEEQALAIFSVKRPSLSSKRWRLARRGALGNGVRVVMGVAHVSGGYLTVESRGVGLRLDVGPDGATRVQERFVSDVEDGSCISLTFGPSIMIDAAEIVEYGDLCQSAAGNAFGGTKAVPTWFDPPAIRDLVRDAPDGTSVLEFARNFDLTAEALVAIKAAAMRTTTAELLLDQDKLAAITGLILAGKKGDRQLKPMGRNARAGAYACFHHNVRLGGALVPVIVECWVRGEPVKDRKTDGDVTVATLYANRTPAIMQRGSGQVLASSKGFALWIGNGVIRVDDVLKAPCDFDMDIAITAPELPLISDGKAIDISAFSAAIHACLRAALPRAYVPPSGKVATPVRAKFLTVKDAVYRLIADTYNAVAAAGIGAPPRMLMYRCRPEILRLTGRDEFDYSTFNSALQDFMDDHPDLTADWSILYDDRGHFIEPGGTKFGLGTLAVDSFIAGINDALPGYAPQIGFKIETDVGHLVASGDPALRFGAVVFVEKEGYTELLAKARIAERFDIAFASTKGLPNTSIRRLLDRLAEHGVKVFVLHDLDISGLNIAHTIATSNKRYTFKNDLDIIDMGVRLGDAEALGLESEPFKEGRSNRDRLRARLRGYGATEAEIEMLVDQGRRIEIDAMTPQQLIDFIERKLTEHGVGKIVPPDDAMAAYYRRAAIEIRLERALAPIRAEMEEELARFADEMRDSPALDIDVPPLREAVGQRLAEKPDETWREAVAAVAVEGMAR